MKNNGILESIRSDLRKSFIDNKPIFNRMERNSSRVLFRKKMVQRRMSLVNNFCTSNPIFYRVLSKRCIEFNFFPKFSIRYHKRITNYSISAIKAN